MKRIIAVVSFFLVLIFTASSVSATEIIIGNSNTPASYTVEHYVESIALPDSIMIKSNLYESFAGMLTEAEEEDFLGYSVDYSFKQDHISSDNSTTIAINYTMDGFETGDVNCDGYIDLLDSTVLQRKAANWEGYDHSKV